MTTIVRRFQHHVSSQRWDCISRAAVAVIGLLISAEALSDTVPLTADTMINGAKPTTDAGSYKFMPFEESNPKVGLVLFDTGGLGGTVIGATLSLNVIKLYTPGSVDVHLVQSFWDEDTTYSSKPIIGASMASFVVGAGDINGSVHIDVRSAVQAWIDGTPNYGLALISNGANGRFGTKEGGQGATLTVSTGPRGPRPPPPHPLDAIESPGDFAGSILCSGQFSSCPGAIGDVEGADAADQACNSAFPGSHAELDARRLAKAALRERQYYLYDDYYARYWVWSETLTQLPSGDTDGFVELTGNCDNWTTAHEDMTGHVINIQCYPTDPYRCNTRTYRSYCDADLNTHSVACFRPDGAD